MNTYIVLSFPLFSNGKAIAAAICRRYGLEHFRIAEVLRDVLRRDLPISTELHRHIDAGQIVPDTLITQLVSHYLNTEKIYKGVLFEHYPRTAAQAVLLDTLLQARNERIRYALGFDPGPEMAQHNIQAAIQAEAHHAADDADPEIYQQRYEASRKDYADVSAHYQSTGVFRPISGWPDVQALL
ncbi:MAG: nucleoside monophosphate kinase [Bacteroidota bacterium]